MAARRETQTNQEVTVGAVIAGGVPRPMRLPMRVYPMLALAICAVACGDSAIPVKARCPTADPSACAGPALPSTARCPGAGPITVATGNSPNSYPMAITTYGADVYWTDMNSGDFATDLTQGTVMRAPACGGSAVTLASGQALPIAIAADASGVYWLNEGDGSLSLGKMIDVISLPAGASTPVLLSSVPNRFPDGFAIDATDVYWTDFDDGSFDAEHPNGASRVMRVSKTGRAAVTVASVEGIAQNVTVDASNIYWVIASVTTSIAMLPKEGGAISTLVSDAGSAFGSFAMTANNFYFADGISGDGVAGLPNTGGVKKELAMAGVASLAADDAGVYWVDVANTDPVTIRGIPSTGGSAMTLASDKVRGSRAFGQSIAVGQSEVYWTTGVGRTAAVMAIAAPWTPPNSPE